MRALLSLTAVVLMFLGGCAPKRVVTPPPGRAPAESGGARVRKTAPGPSRQAGPGPSSSQRAENNQAPAPGSSGESQGQSAAALARQQLGKPYQWGAAGPDRFDCSGLAYFVYGRLGVALPRVSADQARVGEEISPDDLQPGDLLYFAVDSSRINHVGIFVGRRQFVHAPRRYQPVRMDTLDDSYWRNRFKVARRLAPAR